MGPRVLHSSPRSLFPCSVRASLLASLLLSSLFASLLSSPHFSVSLSFHLFSPFFVPYLVLFTSSPSPIFGLLPPFSYPLPFLIFTFLSSISPFLLPSLIPLSLSTFPSPMYLVFPLPPHVYLSPPPHPPPSHLFLPSLVSSFSPSPPSINPLFSRLFPHFFLLLILSPFASIPPLLFA